MPDFLMDYEELYAMQRGMHSLADQAGDGGGSGKFAELGNRTASENTAVFGSSYLSSQFSVFFRMSKQRTEKATEKLRQFGDTFEGVAQALFQQDSEIAAGAAAASAKSEFNRWLDEKERHENWVEATEEWNEYLESIGASDYFEEHPDAVMGEVCAEDDRPDFCEQWENDLDENKAPQQPSPDEPPVPDENPPSRMKFTNADGSTTEVTLSYNEDFEITSETSTTTLPDGEEITQTTDYTYDDDGNVSQETVTVELPDESETKTVTDYTYDADGEVVKENATTTHGEDESTSVREYEGDRTDGLHYDDRDYTVTTENSDGTKSVEDVTINEDGSGTRTVTETDEDGNETTTTYTREGPGNRWVDEDAED
ncbi:hypothetical protein [Streptomyces hainanensis]|uniref:Serine/arginine repetitive matrix protein 2 n=1 Tax=Streptomyces hainanensis TaxID=402648 RepID=A0A4R4SX98_9ACTN|nr:hypothetical protein [Streptomyces hainanensis]TDC68807.1 hypothetical protein E1283_26850 [Streptomyces hainanensis]